MNRRIGRELLPAKTAIHTLGANCLFFGQLLVLSAFIAPLPTWLAEISLRLSSCRLCEHLTEGMGALLLLGRAAGMCLQPTGSLGHVSWVPSLFVAWDFCIVTMIAALFSLATAYSRRMLAARHRTWHEHQLSSHAVCYWL